MDPQSHSITNALASPSGLDTELIVQKSKRRYERRWLQVAEAVIPVHRRRSQGVEDALQETLCALDRRLKGERARRLKGERSFETGEDIRKWGARVINCDALDVLNENLKLDGPSTLAAPGGREAVADEDDLLEVMASVQEGAEPPPDVKAQEAELQARYEGLGRAVEQELGALGAPDREIVDRWLDWHPFRAIAEEFQVRVRDVRVTTFDFKTQPTLARIAEGLRRDLDEAEGRWPGVIRRLVWRGRAGRVLVDLRDEE